MAGSSTSPPRPGASDPRAMPCTPPARGAIVSFTKSLARENARYGITANSLAVGPTDAQLFNANREIPRIGEKLVEGMIQATLLRRAGTVEEVAAAAAFLASDDASYITGENLGVSG